MFETIKNLQAKNKMQKKNDALLVAAMMFAVFAVCAFNIPQRTAIYLSGDEFANYAIAAYFAGYDWSSIASTIGYYQFGYPLVFILPLFWIFGGDMQVIYRMSLVINALLAAGTVPFIYFILKKQELKSNVSIILFTLLSSLSGCVVAYANLGLSEVLLIVLGLALALLVMHMPVQTQTKTQNQKLKLKPGYASVVLLALLLVYGYSVHMRFLGVMLSGVLIFLVMFAAKKVDLKRLAVFALTFGTAFAISLLIKQHIQENLWQAADTGMFTGDLGNDIARNAGRLEWLSSLSGIFSYLKEIGGQMWYMGVASFLFVFAGLYAVIAKSCTSIRKAIKKETADFDYAKLFILTGFITTMLISSLYMIRGGAGTASRGDHFIYGRYNSIMFIPVMLCGLAETDSGILKLRKKRFLPEHIAIAAVFVLLSVFVVVFFRKHYSGMTILYTNIINLYLLQSNIISSAAALAAFSCVLSVQYLRAHPPPLFISTSEFALIKRTKKILSGILINGNILIAAAFSAMIVFNVAAGSLFIGREVAAQEAEYIGFNELSGLRGEDEVFLYRHNDIIHPALVQLALPETKVSLVYSTDGITDTEKPFLISRRNYINAVFGEGLNPEGYTQVKNLLVYNGVKKIDGINTLALPVSFFSTGEGVQDGGSGGGVSPGFVESSGAEGYILFGPHAFLNAGEYTISAQIDMLGTVDYNASAGYCEAVSLSGGNKFDYTGIYPGGFVNGEQTVMLRISADKAVSDLELRIWVHKGVNLRVSNISITKH